MAIIRSDGDSFKRTDCIPRRDLRRGGYASMASRLRHSSRDISNIYVAIPQEPFVMKYLMHSQNP